MKAYRTLLNGYLTYLQSDYNITVDNITDIVEDIIQLEADIANVNYFLMAKNVYANIIYRY